MTVALLKGRPAQKLNTDDLQTIATALTIAAAAGVEDQALIEAWNVLEKAGFVPEKSNYEKALEFIKSERITSRTRLQRKFPKVDASQWVQIITQLTVGRRVKTTWIKSDNSERSMQLEYIES